MFPLSSLPSGQLRALDRPAHLHIPDGFLGPGIAVICWLLTVLVLAVAVRRSQQELGERQVPLTGVLAAFIFAAQMINFPVVGGTSGHLLGGVLAAVALGPWTGMLVMTAVIGVQALLFQDGGLLAMGANILNMGLITVAVGYGLYRAAAGRGRRTQLVVVGVAAWLSVMAAALATSLQLWLSGTSPLQLVVPAMMGVHGLIGVGEALITVAAFAFVMRTRPELLSATERASHYGRGWVVVGILLSLVVVVVSPWASADPDGLERVAEDLGFLERGLVPTYEILPDYALPWLGESGLSTIAAGIVGVAVVAGLAIAIGFSLRRSRQPDTR